MQEYENTQQQIHVTKAGELDPAEQHYNELMARQTAIVSKLELSSILGTMRLECEQLNEQCDVVEREFISGSVTEATTTGFLSTFTDERARYHSMQIKLDAARCLDSSRA